MTNCITMGLSLAEARSITWWEYEALLTTWNERHDPDGEPVEPPDPETISRHWAEIERRGIGQMIS